jgi:hypothetical protein
MKKVLLAGVAALSVLSASAAQTTIVLPDAMLGSWCHDDHASTETQQIYFRTNECPDPFDNISVRRDGYDEVDSICKFETIEHSAKDVYLANTRCEALAEGDGHPTGFFYGGIKEFQIVDGLLFVTIIPAT